MFQEVQCCVDDLAKVVGRDVGRHADGDALRPVDQQVREAGRQDDRLNFVAVVIGDEIDRPLVDAVEQGKRERREPALGVAHRCGAGVGPRSTKVPVSVDERMPQAEVLGHSGQRVIDRQITVRVKAAHDIAHDLGALGMWAIRS